MEEWNTQITPTMRKLKGMSSASWQGQTRGMLPLDTDLRDATSKLQAWLSHRQLPEAITDGGWWIDLKVDRDIAAELVQQGILQYAEPLAQVKVQGLPGNLATFPTDPFLHNNIDKHTLTNTRKAWEEMVPGCKPIVIAVIDSGIAGSNTRLANNLVPQSAWFDAITGKQGQAQTTWTGDERLHGLAVASIIGVNSNDGVEGASMGHDLIKVLPINVMAGPHDPYRNGGSMYTADIDRAIAYASGKVTLPSTMGGTTLTNPYPASVINISLGNSRVDLQELASIKVSAEKALLRGSLIVAAAGNGGRDRADNYAISDLTIGVGSSNDSGKVSTFSNRGEGVDLLAPGEGTQVWINDVITSWQGSSMASPWASAQIGLWAYANQEYSGDPMNGKRGTELFNRVMECLNASRDDQTTTMSVINSAKLVSSSNSACRF